MRVLITGANGFLGRNLIRYLEQFDYELVLTDLSPGLFTTTPSWTNNWTIHYCDLESNFDHIQKLIKGVDVVIHLANRARIQPSWSDYESYYNMNITGSQRLFDLSQKNDVKKFIYISSSSVYGNNGTQIQKETDILMPSNPYALSKMAAEFALKIQKQKGSTELVIVRPFTMYGDFMDFGPNALVISKFINAWEKNQPLIIEGSGNQKRDFLHSSDAVIGLKIILDKSVDEDIFNLGSGKSVSVQQLANAVSNRQIRVPDRVGPISVTHADISRLRSLGFEPKVDVITWLTETIQELKLEKIII